MSNTPSSSSISDYSSDDNINDIDNNTSIIEKQYLLTDFRFKNVNRLLNKYEDYDNYTLQEKMEYLTINSNKFSIQEKFQLYYIILIILRLIY